MFALFAIAFIQVAFAKDLIKENTENQGGFHRVAKGECFPYNEGAFKYVNEHGDNAEVAIYTSKDCTGTATSTKNYTSAELKSDFSFELKDCPKWMGIVTTDSDSNCANKDKNSEKKIYYKEGCQDFGSTSVKYLIEDSALRKQTYKKVKCEELDQRLQFGKCDTCTKAGEEYQFVKCNVTSNNPSNPSSSAISKMIVAVLAVLFFLF